MKKLPSLFKQKPYTNPPTSHSEKQRTLNTSVAVASPPPRRTSPAGTLSKGNFPKKALPFPITITTNHPPPETNSQNQSSISTISYEGRKLNSLSLQFSDPEGVAKKSEDKFYMDHVNYPKKMLLKPSGGKCIYDPNTNKILYAEEFYLHWDNSGKISSFEINGNKKIVNNVRVITNEYTNEDEVHLEFEQDIPAKTDTLTVLPQLNISNSIVIRLNRCCIRSVQISYPHGAKNLNDYTTEELFGQNGIFTDERKNYDKLMSNIFQIHLGEQYRTRNILIPENICIQNNSENNLSKFQINDLPNKRPNFHDCTDDTGDRTYSECIYDSPRGTRENIQVIRESYEATIALLTKFGIYNWTHLEFLKDEFVPQIENWYNENKVFDWIKEIRIDESGESNLSEIKKFLTQVDPTPLLNEIFYSLKTVNPLYTKTVNTVEKYLSDNPQKENVVLLMGIISFLVSAKKATNKNMYDADMKSLLERIQNPSLKKLISQLEEVCKFECAPIKIMLSISNIFDKLSANSSCNEWIEVLCKASEQYGGPAGKEAAEKCRKHKEENPKMYESMEQIFQAVQNPNQKEALENLYDYFQVPFLPV